MPDNRQMDITGRFDDAIQERRDRVADLRARADELATAWRSVFGDHDTPVPVDRAWHKTEAALQHVQTQIADDYLDAAETSLNEAAWIVEQECASSL